MIRSSERSISVISSLSAWARRAIRRSTSVTISGRGRSRAAVGTSCFLGTPSRRWRRSSGAVTITASSWLSAAVWDRTAPRRSSRSTRSCSRAPRPRGRLNPRRSRLGARPASRRPGRSYRHAAHHAWTARTHTQRCRAWPEMLTLHSLVEQQNGAKRIRTADLLGAIQALSQLSYSPANAQYIERQAESDPGSTGASAAPSCVFSTRMSGSPGSRRRTRDSTNAAGIHSSPLLVR